VVGHEDHNPTPGAFSRHTVRVEGTSLLHKLVGWDERSVPAHHHQGIDRLGSGLSAVGWAGDGTIGAVEDPTKPFLFGVQWHAEADDDPALFESLVDAATGRANAVGRERRSAP